MKNIDISTVSEMIINDNQYLLRFVDGLGQLSDGQTGPDNHEDPQGFQWVNSQGYSFVDQFDYFPLGWLA